MSETLNFQGTDREGTQRPAYKPQSDLLAKLSRRAARHLFNRTVTPDLDRGLISFTFDDCPRSVFENALPALEARDWRATIYACVGLCNTSNHLGLHMSEDDLWRAHEAGHDIADHTYSHVDTRDVGVDVLAADIARNRAAFERIGLPRASSFAFPYGEVTLRAKRRLKSDFELSRGIHSPAWEGIDLALAPAAKLYSDDLDQTLEQIERAAREKRWLILFGHDVRKSPSEYGCTPAELQRVIERVSALPLDVLSVNNALKVITP